MPRAPNSCRRRPDFLWFITLLAVMFGIILEVDEGYHENYDPWDEMARYGELCGSMPGRALLFLRYHPLVHTRRLLPGLLAEALRSGSAAAREGGGVHIVYLGYPPERISELNANAVAIYGAELSHSVVS